MSTKIVLNRQSPKIQAFKYLGCDLAVRILAWQTIDFQVAPIASALPENAQHRRSDQGCRNRFLLIISDNLVKVVLDMAVVNARNVRVDGRNNHRMPYREKSSLGCNLLFHTRLKLSVHLKTVLCCTLELKAVNRCQMRGGTNWDHSMLEPTPVTTTDLYVDTCDRIGFRPNVTCFAQ